MAMGIELLREWDAHNRRHSCYYESEQNDGMGECPSYYETLGDYLGAAGFPVENLTGQFFGRDLSEPNFRSENSGREKPVSIAEMRRRGDLRANKGVHYRQRTDETLRQRSSRARNEPVENERQPWEVDAMDYFNRRLDEIHESMVRGMGGIMAEQERLHTRIDALVALVSESLDERSESAPAGVEVGNIITLYGVEADVVSQLREELDTRLARLIARKKREQEG